MCKKISRSIWSMLRETTPSIQYLTTLAQWLWNWLFIRASLVRIWPGHYISAMHLFISFFVADFGYKILSFGKEGKIRNFSRSTSVFRTVLALKQYVVQCIIQQKFSNCSESLVVQKVEVKSLHKIIA